MTAEDAAAIRWTNLCGSLSHNAAWQSFRHAASFERISLMESFKGTAQRRCSSTLFSALLCLDPTTVADITIETYERKYSVCCKERTNGVSGAAFVHAEGISQRRRFALSLADRMRERARCLRQPEKSECHSKRPRP